MSTVESYLSTTAKARQDTALLSPDGIYRHRLDRFIDVGNRIALFVMLNPSTADASVDDPTIRRCLTFSFNNRCSRLAVVNLYDFRATDPKVMRRAAVPSSPINDTIIFHSAHEVVQTGGIVICAWGNGAGRKAYSGRALEVMKILQSAQCNPHCLGETAHGSPRHPLYVPSFTKLEPHWFSDYGL